MLSFLQRLLGLRGKDPRAEHSLVQDDDCAWLYPPTDMHDPAVWDLHWNNQVSHGLGPPLFDMFIEDHQLIGTMFELGMKTVLCAGNGISQEPRALAEAGFEVTALDLSPVALKLAQAWRFDPSELKRYFEQELQRPGGKAQFVAGDILDPMVCPGPFDVVIERLTLQNFSVDERQGALEALIARLRPDGIFISHCHDGAWKPPAAPFHATRPLFVQRKWTIWEGQPGAKAEGPIAWLVTSTG